MCKAEIYSPYKIAHHMDRLKQIKEGKIPPPVNAQIDWTNLCTLNCSFCIYRNAGMDVEGMHFDPDKSIQREHGLRLLEELAAIGVKSIESTGGGEPTLHPNFNEFVRHARKLGLQQALITNGTLVDEETARNIADFEWVRFSIDAATRETYEKIKGVDAFDKVIRNLKGLLRVRKEGNVVGFSFVVCRENYREIYDAARLAKELGCDNIRISLAMTPQREKLFIDIWDEIMAQIEQARKLEDENFRVFAFNNRIFDLQSTEPQNCIYTYLVAVVTPTGCFPCCRLKSYPEFNFGNVQEKSFKEIWWGEKRMRFLNTVAKRCTWNCWMREKNKFAEYLLTDNPKHVNYI